MRPSPHCTVCDKQISVSCGWGIAGECAVLAEQSNPTRRKVVQGKH